MEVDAEFGVPAHATYSDASAYSDPRGYLAAHGLNPDKEPTTRQALGLVRSLVHAMGRDASNGRYQTLGTTIHYTDENLPPSARTIKAVYVPPHN